MNTDALENKLMETGYRELFMYTDKNIVDSIWKGGKNETPLKHIIASGSASLHAKFLAAEILRYFEVELDMLNYGILAEAYAYALEYTSADRNNSVQLNGNLWGFLYEEDDTGYLGRQFIKFGDAAIPPLTTLLDDTSDRILYEGSQEATIGNSYQYRTKDFAAFYISKMKNIPVKFYQDFGERDKEIARLKELLKKH